MNKIFHDDHFMDMKLIDFLRKEKFSDFFISHYVIPMGAAIWSLPPDLAEKIPLDLFINFFKNHRLFKIKNRPQWYTVTGRSKVYVNKALESISGKYFKDFEVSNVSRNKGGVRLNCSSKNKSFD